MEQSIEYGAQRGGLTAGAHAHPSAQRQPSVQHGDWIRSHHQKRRKVVQYEMLAAVRKKLMLGVIIDACLQRQIEQRKARPECNPARAVHLYMAGAAQIELFCFQAEDGIRDDLVTGVQTCALPILSEVTGWIWTPIQPRLTEPLSFSWA